MIDLSNPPSIVWQSPSQAITPRDRLLIECAKAWQEFVNHHPVKADKNVGNIYRRFMYSCANGQDARYLSAP